MGYFSQGALHPNNTVLLCPRGHKYCAGPDNHSTTSASPLETPAPPQAKSPPSLPVCSRLLCDRDPDHPHPHRLGLEDLHRQQEYRDLVLCREQSGRELICDISASPRKD